MNPEQQARIGGVVGGTAFRDAATDRSVDGVDATDGTVRLPGAAEDDREGRGQRASQPGERVIPEGRVLRDRGGDRRMRELEQQGACPAAEDEHLAVDAPRHAVRPEEAGIGDASGALVIRRTGAPGPGCRGPWRGR